MFSKTQQVTLAMGLCLALLFLEQSGVGIALVKIANEFSLSNTFSHWLMNGFLVPLVIFLIIFGRIADIYGHYPIFIMGLIVFAIAALCCALAPSGIILLGGRILQGLGAAMLIPTNLALINLSVPVEQRGKALGTVVSAGSIFLVLGPLICGALSTYLSWRYIFWINIPVICAIAYFAHQGVTIRESHGKGRFDYLGAFLLTISLSFVFISLMQAADWGLTDNRFLSMLFIGIFTLALFVYLQMRSPQPLIDFSLFGDHELLAVNITLMTTQVCVLSLILLALWLQTQNHFSAWESGLALLPAIFFLVPLARVGGKLYDSEGPRRPILWGTFLILVGFLWISCTVHFNHYWLIFPGLLIYGIGAPIVIPTCLTHCLSRVELRNKGMVSGIANTMRQLACYPKLLGGNRALLLLQC